MPTPSFTPQGIVRLGNVPFDNSYKHTVMKNWADADAMAAEFAQRLNNLYTEDTYTYIRANNSIRVNFNAEKMYWFNYCMYQNTNYPDILNNVKWYYAFITDVIYINENCTELVLEIDVIHTFWFDFHLEQCYVEREHVADDTVGANIVPEPSMPLFYEYDSFVRRDMTPRWVVFQICQFPFYQFNNPTDPSAGYSDNAIGSISVSGGKYQKFISATKYLVYDLNNANSVAAMQLDMKTFNSTGAADGIQDGYVLPEYALAGYDNETHTYLLPGFKARDYDPAFNYRWTFNDNLPVYETDWSINRPTIFGTYTPKNNKLFTFPYTYVELGDYSGRTQEYRFEFFNNPAQVTLKETFVSTGDCTAYIYPLRYQNLTSTNTSLAFTYDFTNKISWVYSAFQNWLAQNMLGNAIALTLGVAGVAGGIAVGVTGAAAMAEKLSLAKHAKSAAKKSLRGSTNPSHFGGNRALALAADVTQSTEEAGALTLAGTLANIDRMRHIPNQSRGNISGNSKFQCDLAGYYRSVVRLREDSARIVDDFLSMYGYAVDRIKVPEIFSRVGWNYVKCTNSDNHGNAPMQFVSMFNDILNDGITFWHNWNVGDYSISNTIVS